MWPSMGSMGWWMVLWWGTGLIVLVLLVLLVLLAAGAAGGLLPRGDESLSRFSGAVTRRAKSSARSTNAALRTCAAGWTDTRTLRRHPPRPAGEPAAAMSNEPQNVSTRDLRLIGQ